MVDATAQELTHELIAWQRGKDPGAVVPALLVAAAKVAVGAGESERLEEMVSLLRAVFREEREKYTTPPVH